MSYTLRVWVLFASCQIGVSTFLYTAFYRPVSIYSLSICSPGRSAIPTLRWSISPCGAGSIWSLAPLNLRPQSIRTISLSSIGTLRLLWNMQRPPSANNTRDLITCLRGHRGAAGSTVFLPVTFASRKRTRACGPADRPLYRVFDVHSPLPLRSCHDHLCWSNLSLKSPTSSPRFGSVRRRWRT